MRTMTDQERWVLAVGDVVDEIVDLTEAEQEAEVVQRLPHAVLVRTTNRRAVELRRLPNAIIRVFETERDGQRALGLFVPDS
ncbi:MAG: hypothetical protein ACXVQU_06805 [Actinomycetota bacterium]